MLNVSSRDADAPPCRDAPQSGMLYFTTRPPRQKDAPHSGDSRVMAHAFVPADAWHRLIPSARLLSKKQIRHIFKVDVILRFEGPLQWHYKHHFLMPPRFREMAFSFVACNKLGHMPYLPTEMIWEILSHFWWTGACREMLRCRIR